MATSDELHFGFMGPIIGRAKKVLFPDVESSCHGRSLYIEKNGPSDSLSTSHNGDDYVNRASSASSSREQSSNEPGKRVKSRRRRAHRNNTGVSLANIAEGSVKSGFSIEDVEASGKENAVPKQSYVKNLNKRGNVHAMDSLAAIASSDTDSHASRKNTNVYLSKNRSMMTKGKGSRGKGNNDRSVSQGCDSFGSFFGSQNKDSEYRKKADKQRVEEIPQMKLATKKGHNQPLVVVRRFKGHTVDKDSNDFQSSQHRSGTMQQQKEGYAELEHQRKEPERSKQKHRRRGRCHHPPSSLLIQSQPTQIIMNHNKKAISSLMNLQSSTQKLHRNKPIKKKKSSKHALLDRVHSKDNVSSLTKNVEAMNLGQKPMHDIAEGDATRPSHGSGTPSDTKKRVAWRNRKPSPSSSMKNETGFSDDQMSAVGSSAYNSPDFQSPYTIRRRPTNGCTSSPPMFVHRLSSISNSSFFQKASSACSPAPRSNPRKRLDKKKTPCKMSDEASGSNAQLASAAEMAISPLKINYKSIGTSVNRPMENDQVDAHTPQTASLTTNIAAGPHASYDKIDCFSPMKQHSPSCNGLEKSDELNLSHDCTSPFNFDVSEPLNTSCDEENDLSLARTKLFSSKCEEQENSSLTELEDAKDAYPKHTPGSAVIAIEAVTPRFVRRVENGNPPSLKDQEKTVRGTSVIDFEYALQIHRKESMPSPSIEENSTHEVQNEVFNADSDSQQIKRDSKRNSDGESDAMLDSFERETESKLGFCGGESDSKLDSCDGGSDSKLDSCDGEIQVETSERRNRLDECKNGSTDAEQLKQPNQSTDESVTEIVDNDRSSDKPVEINASIGALEPPVGVRRSTRQSKQTDRLNIGHSKGRKERDRKSKLSSLNKECSSESVKQSTQPLNQVADSEKNVNNGRGHPSEEPVNSDDDMPIVADVGVPTEDSRQIDEQNASERDLNQAKECPKANKQSFEPHDLECYDNGLHLVAGPRRSTRQSKQTDRLTVDWENNQRCQTIGLNKSKDCGHAVVRPLTSDVEGMTSIPEESAIDNFSEISKDSAEKSPHDKVEYLTESIDKNAKPSPDTIPTAEHDTDGHWTNDDLMKLHSVQNDVNPTSATYWDDVSSFIPGKSGQECREKWFSLVATPKGRQRKKKGGTQHVNNDTSFHSSTLDEEDDLFDSTPLRDAVCEIQSEMIAKGLRRDDFGNSLGLSPCMQQHSSPESQQSNSPFYNRVRYKTYIDNLRKELKRAQKSRKCGAHKSYHGSLKGSEKDIRANFGDGENHISGRLLPDGTLDINLQTESDLEDDIFDLDEGFCFEDDD